jgi:hypothetical protein
MNTLKVRQHKEKIATGNEDMAEDIASKFCNMIGLL